MSRFVRFADGWGAGVRKILVSLVTVLVLAAIFAFQTGAVSFGSGDGTYAFIRHQAGDPAPPVTFSPCKPIRVEINLEGVDDPETAQRTIVSAMAEVSAASGLQLQYVGPSTRRPHWPDHTLSSRAAPGRCSSRSPPQPSCPA